MKKGRCLDGAPALCRTTRAIQLPVPEVCPVTLDGLPGGA
jgi:hypothetical protein